MSRSALAVSLSLIALTAASVYLYFSNRRMEVEIERLGETVGRMTSHAEQLQKQIAAIETNLASARTSSAVSDALCDRVFPTGLYRLETSSNYGANSVGAYEIYHVSVVLSEWSVNVGTRLNAYGLPTDFYLDYDGDGRIDTALAARFVREIPLAGNTIADRLLADSRVHQNLYAVFSCEWRNAEFTSSDDMNAQVSGTSNMLWDLVQDQSENIVQWIRGL